MEEQTEKRTVRLDFDKLSAAFPRAYFDTAAGCVEQGYDDKPVIMANWNYVKDGVMDALEAHGWACEWSDEWIVCEGCNKAFRTSPDSYGWQSGGIIDESGVYCLECLDPESYYESLENNPRKAVTIPIFEKHPPEDFGYTLVSEGFESGFHPGQNDDPKAILKDMLAKNPTGRFLFVMDGQGQFDVSFRLYVHKEEESDE